MGSASSTAVKKFGSEVITDDKQDLILRKETQNAKGNLVLVSNGKLPRHTEMSSETCSNDHLDTIAELEKKLAESESERLDLHDQVQSLGERLAENLQWEGNNIDDSCSETLVAKDMYIKKLESELKALQSDMAKMKSHHKKKLKGMQSVVSELKQESSIKLFELKSEMCRVTEENDQLKTSLLRSSQEGDGESVSKMNSHMSLILSLSQQVSEQAGTIKKLQEGHT